MSNVLNRTTLEIHYSVHTPDYPPEIWVINPDLTILQTVPMKYLKLVGDILTEMTASEKAVVDAAELVSSKETYISQVCQAREWKISHGSFEYPSGSGKYLPATSEDQTRWIGWESIGGKWSSLGLSYPFRVYSKDGRTYTDITKALDFTAVVESMWVFITGKFTGAETVVQGIKNATTLQEVSTAIGTYFDGVEWDY
jgi:hypothetical protein